MAFAITLTLPLSSDGSRRVVDDRDGALVTVQVAVFHPVDDGIGYCLA